MKILIVDDDRTSCSILSGRLTAAGHKTLTAFDAMSGFTSIMRERPDLVILDLGMPAGGGFSVAQADACHPRHRPHAHHHHYRERRRADA
jgi:DNA-binding response OmpR family regulator